DSRGVNEARGGSDAGRVSAARERGVQCVRDAGAGAHYIVLLSDVVDALESERGAIDFYIGHELGHIRRKHLLWGPVLAEDFHIDVRIPARGLRQLCRVVLQRLASHAAAPG
ncbi:MAG: M48 family metalloprotease, partial [Burkholderiales bacterium]